MQLLFFQWIEITFDEYKQTICDNCKNGTQHKEESEESKLSQILDKIPNLEQKQ